MEYDVEFRRRSDLLRKRKALLAQKAHLDSRRTPFEVQNRIVDAAIGTNALGFSAQAWAIGGGIGGALLTLKVLMPIALIQAILVNAAEDVLDSEAEDNSRDLSKNQARLDDNDENVRFKNERGFTPSIPGIDERDWARGEIEAARQVDETPLYDHVELHEGGDSAIG